ncbi:MAG: ABC transporter ATP-binding protein [Spirochaetae bacterium HGW-Spirochaetae-5]|nr:MAG: ABC transporter ATP-binding protein [Spirochaetae bacterium HGW-Spirochaetae-5]
MAKIVIENLHKSFGEKSVLKGINLSVEQGEILCVIGKSGTGKSVILKHLVGIIEPDEGAIIVDGVTMTGSNDSVKREIVSRYGILFQGAALFDSMNIFDNVAFGLRRRGVDEDKIKIIVEESLTQVGLPDAGDKRPSELSGGMQKRAGLARSIAVRPDIMLYDEPTTGVDPITAGVVDRLIVKMRDTYAMTSVVVTHDMTSAYRIADRIAMVYEGKVIFTGTNEEIKKSEDPYVRQFIEGTIHGPINAV